MKSQWLHRSRQERLIIFCNGWGMDATPFQPIGVRDYDLLMFFDYYDLILDCDLATLFQSYQDIVLISWSMGVWAGQQIFQPWSHRLRKAIAVNGTLCPIHDQFGIPVALYEATLAQFSEAGRLKFYRRMCRDHRSVDAFLKNQPQRSLENQRRELASLLGQVSCRPAEDAIYTQVVIADKDLVVPAANQLAFWQGEGVHRIEGAHFPFYGWQSWDELVATP